MTQQLSDDNGTASRLEIPRCPPAYQDIAVLPTGLLGDPSPVQTLREELIARHEQAAHERSEDAAHLADGGLHLLRELQALFTHLEALHTLSARSAAQAQKLAALNLEIAGKQEDYRAVRTFCDLLNHEAGLHLQAAQRLRRRTL